MGNLEILSWLRLRKDNCGDPGPSSRLPKFLLQTPLSSGLTILADLFTSRIPCHAGSVSFKILHDWVSQRGTTDRTFRSIAHKAGKFDGRTGREMERRHGNISRLQLPLSVFQPNYTARLSRKFPPYGPTDERETE